MAKITKSKIESQKEKMDRIIDWVKACDNKTSIVMTIALLVPTFIIGTDWVLEKLDQLVTLIWYAYDSKGEGYIFSWINCVALVLFALTLILTSISLLKFLKVLNAKINENTYEGDVRQDSLIHFHYIAKINDYKAYKDLVNEENDVRYYEDLLSQTYINAKRCTEKFEDYKSGVTWLSWALISLVLFIVSLFFIVI